MVFVKDGCSLVLEVEGFLFLTLEFKFVEKVYKRDDEDAGVEEGEEEKAKIKVDHILVYIMYALS